MRDRADDGLNLARREEASCVAAPAQCVSIVARLMPASRHQDHPRLRRKLTAEEFARLEHVVVSLRGGEFATPVDKTLARLGLKRNVVLSAASFLFVPEIVTNSNFVALVPARRVSHRDDRLKVVAYPLPVEGFAIGMAWHERNHGHSGHRWIRHLIASLVGSETGDRKRRATRP